MAIFGNERDIHQAFKFLVEIDGIVSAKFQECSELSVEFGEMRYFEGGALTTEGEPTRAEYAEITLTRGAATGDSDIWDWWSDHIDAAANRGDASPSFKRTLDIVQLNRANVVLRRYTLYNAWIRKLVEGPWGNESDDPTIEAITLRYRYFDKTYEAAA
jgi:phage tail-like protein